MRGTVATAQVPHFAFAEAHVRCASPHTWCCWSPVATCSTPLSQCALCKSPCGVQGIEEAGTRLAQVLTKKESIAKMKASMPAEVAKSLARLSGREDVITDASWVAQASFEPLGLTVAVAKDRAIESLMQVTPLHACVKCVARTQPCTALALLPSLMAH